MATLSNRITQLEQMKKRFFDVRDMTDGELLEYLGLPDDATDEQLQAIINEGVHHGND